MSTIYSPSTADSSWLSIVQHKASSIRYGVVQVVIHDGKVTVIEVTEKTRLDSPTPRPKR